MSPTAADVVVSIGARLVTLWDRLMAVPGARPALEGCAFLLAVSGAFWFLSGLLGRAALALHDALDHSLAVLFAVSYNLALAVLFGAVMAAAVFRAGEGSALMLAYQAAGFLLVYLVLSAAYADAQGAVDEYAAAGYAAGLTAFLAGCVSTAWLSWPAVRQAEAWTVWAWSRWPGKAVAALSTLEGLLYAYGCARRKLFWKSVKVGGRRFFFDVTEVLGTENIDELRVQAA